MDCNRTQLRAEETLGEALLFLKGRAWPDAVTAALAAEKLARGMKTEEARRTWLTVANLVIVAAQDEHPYFQDDKKPPILDKMQDELDKDIPF